MTKIVVTTISSPSQIKTVREERTASTVITTTFTTTIVNTNVQLQLQVETIYYLTKIHPSQAVKKINAVVSRGKQTEKKEHFISYR